MYGPSFTTRKTYFEFTSIQKPSLINIFNLGQEYTQGSWHIQIQHTYRRFPWGKCSRLSTKREITTFCKLRLSYACTLYLIKQHFTHLCLKCPDGKKEDIKHLVIE